MLTLAVVLTGRAGPLPERGASAILSDPSPNAVPHEVGEHLMWTNEAGTVSFAAWKDVSDPYELGHYCHVDERGLTAFAGWLWPREVGWTGTGPWAGQLATQLAARPVAPGEDRFSGAFVLASLTAAGPGVMTADPLGVALLYLARGRTVSVLSTRASLAAELLAVAERRQPVRDTFGAGWMAFARDPKGRSTGFRNVTVVPEGAVVTVSNEGEASVRPSDQPPWLAPGADCDAAPELLAAARTEMMTTLRMAITMSRSRVRAGLTGGKDTRLILALLLEAGLQDAVDFETRGAADLPDVLVAEEIARTFGLRHRRNPDRRVQDWLRCTQEAVRADGLPSASPREIAVRLTVWNACGTRNVVEPIRGQLPEPDDLLLSGFGGEVLRTNYTGATGIVRKADAARIQRKQGYGSARILRPDAFAGYQREFHDLLFDGVRPTDSPLDVLDAFYLRHDMRRWFGPEQALDARRRVFPLYSISAVRLAFAIGGENRHAEWIHWNLTRDASARLAEMPFAGSGWRSDLRGTLVEPRRYDDPVPAVLKPDPPKPRAHRPDLRTVGTDRLAENAQIDAQLMQRYLVDERSNPLFEIVDPAAIARQVASFAAIDARERAQLYGALSAAIWLGGHEVALPRGSP